ncbi:MAG: phosphoribosyltransferase [Candidatus Bathyarchaeia archaeon]
MKSAVSFEVLTWEKTYSMLLTQAEKIRQSGFKPDIIVGIAKGGWVPARVLADLLEVSDLAAVRIEFYVGVAETKTEPTLTEGVSTAAIAGKKALLVDDVADTGKSLQLARAHVLQHGAADARIATLYKKPWSIIKPDYCEAETNCWVVFPWERKETLRKIVMKHREKGVIDAEMAKLVKAGLPKQLAKRFLKEIFEAGKC